ncbi:MAG: universal stress protein [Kistimonas sp.]|nr:universal stress protein [Kistimonas sp.]
MALYKHILVALDLGEESAVVLEKARQIAEQSEARLTLVHVIEPLSLSYGNDIPLDLTSLLDEIVQQAKDRVAQLAEDFSVHVDKKDRCVIYGRPEREVHRMAEESDVDLIVVGSHGRHGLSLVLGSTSTSILHGACCDVLAVRVGKPSRPAEPASDAE